jgi:hypothetical protein
MHCWAEHAALAGWTFLAILYRGFGFGVGDQNLYLPFVLKWANPEIFPNDYLLSLGYARESVTWITLSWASRLVDIRLVTGAAYVLTSYLTLWAILRLAQAWWDDRLAGWIAVLLWAPVYELPGSAMNTVDPYFTGRGLAYALCFLALLLLLRNRTAGVVFCLCGAALVHSVSIIPVAGAAALYYLFRNRWRDFVALSISVAGTALVLLAMASKGGGHDLWARYDPEWHAIAVKGAQCLFPTEWGAQIWARLLLYAVLCAAVLLMGRVLKEAVPWSTLGWSLFASSLLLWVISWVGTEARFVLLVQLSLMRSCLFMILLLCLVLAGWCARLLHRGTWSSKLVAALALGGWIFDQPLFQTMALVVAAVAVITPWEGVFLRRWTERGLIRPHTGILVVALIAAGLYALNFYAAQSLPWSTPSPWAFAQTGVAVAGMVLGWLLLPEGRLRWATTVMAAAFGMAIFVQPPGVAIQSLGQLPGLNRLYGLSRGHAFPKRARAPIAPARERLADVIRTSVPLGATVIVPVGWENFRVMARRSSFVTKEDRIPSEFSRSFAMEWRSRMVALYGQDACSREGNTEGAPPLGEDDLVALTKRYARINLGYLVTTRRYTFPEVATVGAWAVYHIEPKPGQDAPPAGP